MNFFHQRSKFSLKKVLLLAVLSSLEIQTRSWNKWPVELFNMYSLLYTNSSFPGNERCDLHRGCEQVLQYSHIWLVLDHFWATWLIWYSFTPYGWVVAFLKDKNFWKYPIMQVTSIMSQKRITMNMLEWKSCKCSTVPQDFSILTIFNSNHAPFQLFRFQKMMYYP